MGNIQIKNLSFRYDAMAHDIFKHVNLNIDETWKLGLIGRNGRGKTTFLQLLLGKYTYQGIIQSNLNFDYFPRKILNPNVPVKDLVIQYSNLDQYTFWKFEVEVPKMGLDIEIINRKFDTLSPGEQTKVLLALMFTENDTFKLIDEPTNHLDLEGRMVLAKYLKQKSGFIVVSHDEDFINQVIDHVLSIERSKIELLKGTYQTWEKKYLQDNSSEAKENDSLKREINKLQSSAERLNRWSNRAENEKSAKSYKGQKNVYIDKGFLGHKAAKLMKRSKKILQRVEQDIEYKKGLLKNIDKTPQLSLNYQPPYQRNIVLLTSVYLRQGQSVLNQNAISFLLKQGERLIISSANGSGKTTLLKAILGHNTLIKSGFIDKSSTLKISYLEQDFDSISGTLQDYLINYQVEMQDMLNMLTKLGLSRFEFDKDLSNLSMGQKRKITLARSLCESANLYVWDEPLNYLDILSRKQIKNLILDVKPTMIIVDHDRNFTNNICATTKITID